MGDFNAQYTSWYGYVNNNNTRGIALSNTCLNVTTTPTLVQYGAEHTPTLPDLVLANNDSNISQPLTIAALSSNHLLVGFDITVAFTRSAKREYR